MRMLMQMSIPVEAGNHAARTGAFGPTLQKILEPLKPEAVYFTTMPGGERGGFVVFDMEDTSQIPGIAEPLFLTYNAKLTFTPVMSAEDLAKSIPGIEKAVRAYGKGASA